MLDFLTRATLETVHVLYEASIYMLVGFFVAGLFHEFLSTQAIARFLGRNNPRSVVLAALFGAPIPLCSCGVLPAAAELRKKGASRSSLLSFLISTPETGFDSVALTYALMGPVMALARPIVAVATGIAAGLVAILVKRDEAVRDLNGPAGAATACDDQDASGSGAETPETLTATTAPLAATQPTCKDASCGCPSESGASAGAGPAGSTGWRARLRRVVRYGLGTLIDDIAVYLVVGIVLTGLIAALLPDDFFSTALGWDRGLVPMLVMIVAGVPLYLCASASTPVAAALIAKGLSPGAALVFLLVGPATNVASMTVVGKILGFRHLRIYIGTIILVSLGAGLLLDAVAADAIRLGTLDGNGDADPTLFMIVKVLATLLFVILLGASFRRVGVSESWQMSSEHLRRFIRTFRTMR